MLRIATVVEVDADDRIAISEDEADTVRVGSRKNREAGQERLVCPFLNPINPRRSKLLKAIMDEIAHIFKDDERRTRATSLRTEREYSLEESIYNFVSWIREQPDRAIAEIMAELDDLCKNVRS